MNGFNGYNGIYPSTMPNAGNYNPQQMQPETIFDWVSGRSGAEAYMLRPNKNAFLMDSNNSILYAKGTDVYGRYSPLMSYRLVPIEESSYEQALPPAEAIDYDRIRSIVNEEVTRQMEMTNRPQKREGK